MTPAGTDFAHTQAAEDARVVKARQVASWCWDAGVDPGEIGSWSEEVRRRVARAVGVNPPGSWATWARVVQLLEMKGEWAVGHASDERAGRAGVRPEWLPVPGEACPRDDTTTETPLAKNISSAPPKTEQGGGAPAGLGAVGDGLTARDVEMEAADRVFAADIAAAVERHPAGKALGRVLDGVILPRGWSVLVESGNLLGFGRVCDVDDCGKPAVAALLASLRCAGHPPQPGEWGAALDWAPNYRPCAPNRCYKGCCESWRPAPTPLALQTAPDDDPDAATNGLRAVRDAARASRSRS